MSVTVCLIEDRKNNGLKALSLNVLNGCQFLILQDRARQSDMTGICRLRLDDVALVSEVHSFHDDDVFTDAVDRRVRDLSEQLLKVVIEELRLIREDGDRAVVTHSADRFGSGTGHRDDHLSYIFVCITEHLLLHFDIGNSGFSCLSGLGRCFCRRLIIVNEIGKSDHVLIDPLLVRMRGRDLLLDLFVGDDPSLFGIDQEHSARTQTVLADHAGLIDRQYTCFRREDNITVFCHDISCRTKSVSIEGRDDGTAIGKCQCGRTVPWLHEHAVIFVECLDIFVHLLVLDPRLRDHHHGGLSQRSSGQSQELKSVIEHRRVRTVRVDDRQYFFHIIAKSLVADGSGSCIHRIDVTAKGVDLTVMDQVAVWMRTLPAREGVGAVTGVNERQGGIKGQVLQVEIESIHLFRGKHALIDDRSCGKTSKIEIARIGLCELDRSLFEFFTDNIKRAVKCDTGLGLVAPADEDLRDIRTVLLRGHADRAFVDRCITPAENDLTFFFDRLIDDLHALFTCIALSRKEDHSDTVITELGECDIFFGTNFSEKSIRDLKEHTCTVTGVLVAALTTTVCQICKNLKTVFHSLVGTLAVNVHDKTDTARIVFIFWRIQSLLLHHHFLFLLRSEKVPGENQKTTRHQALPVQLTVSLR